MEILKAVILLGIMGLIFGAVLAFAAQKFAVIFGYILISDALP